jgi:hypothetical protein
MEGWGFLTNHARVLLCIARDPGVRLRDIASSLGITERSAHGFVTDLTAAGYVLKQKDGRRNRYQIQAHMPLREPASQEPAIGEVLCSPRRHARPSVTGQPGRVIMTSAASASQSRKLPEPAGQQDAAVGQTRKAGHRDMVRNEEERHGGAATRRPIRARRRGRHIPVCEGEGL